MIPFSYVIALRYLFKILVMIRDFFLGFIKIYILHHASEEPVYGLWLIEELGRHGYFICRAEKNEGGGMARPF